MRALIHRLLIRLGILASPEEAEYFDWADQRLDEMAAELRRRKGR